MPITVTSITPVVAQQGETVTCDIGGTGFSADCAAQLKRGVTTINGTNVVFVSSTLLRATFAIPAGTTAQTYNIAVSNQVPETGQLNNGFTVLLRGTAAARGQRLLLLLLVTNSEDEFWDAMFAAAGGL